MSTSNAPVKWAQRKDKLFITVEVKDAKDVKVDFQESSISVTGKGVHNVGGSEAEFKTVLALSDSIDASASTFKASGFAVQICAIKKDAHKEHWGKLTKEAPKALKNWLAVDWSLWKDEEDEIAGEKVDFGGYGDMGGGMGGMGGGMGGMDMAQLMAQMGGMGGMGGLGGGFGGGDEGEEGQGGADSDDEAEPPNLEDVDGKTQ
jgi:cytosolic prostaglandin-E synthase